VWWVERASIISIPEVSNFLELSFDFIEQPPEDQPVEVVIGFHRLGEVALVRLYDDDPARQTRDELRDGRHHVNAMAPTRLL
jgi:hypothetical protein